MKTTKLEANAQALAELAEAAESEARERPGDASLAWEASQANEAAKQALKKWVRATRR